MLAVLEKIAKSLFTNTDIINKNMILSLKIIITCFKFNCSVYQFCYLDSLNVYKTSTSKNRMSVVSVLNLSNNDHEFQLCLFYQLLTLLSSTEYFYYLEIHYNIT